MGPQEIFYIVASVCMVVFLVVSVWVAVVLIKTLQVLRGVFEEIKDTAQNISIMKEGFKVGILTFLGRLLGEKKEGEN